MSKKFEYNAENYRHATAMTEALVQTAVRYHKLNEEANRLNVELQASQRKQERAKALIVVADRKRVEKALCQAKEETECANRSKDDFVATLSHELRTPLTPALITASSMERDQALPEESRQQIRVIRRSLELEARIIDDLLDLTRITRGKLSIKDEIVDVHELLTRAMDVVSEDLFAKRITLKTETSAAYSSVCGDPGRLQQVFWSLLKNASKFTPAGGRINVRTSNPNTASILIQIGDTGIGISPDNLERIFLPFEQGAINDHRYGGLGLGLAISKSLIESHRGRIVAQSEGVDHGATFSVTLPVRAARQAEKRSAVGIPSDPSPHLHILLVEDNEATRSILVRLLSLDGHEVKSASTIAEAIQTAHAYPCAEPLEVLISDIGLPDGTGLALVHELKAETPGLTAIALSGYGSEKDIEKSMEAGFNMHLTKPITIEELRRCLAA